MDPGELLVSGARWMLMLTFALSFAEKVSTLATRSSAWHPVLLANPGLRRHASAGMTAAAVADASVVTVLALSPVIGGVAAICLIGVYTLAARSVHMSREDSCRCLWGPLDTHTRTSLLARNLVLLAAASSVAIWPVELELAALPVAIAQFGVLALILAAVDKRRWSRARELSVDRRAERGRELPLEVRQISPSTETGAEVQ